MATFSNNIRVNGAVSFERNTTTGPGGTLYTAPANGYAILTVSNSGSVPAGLYSIGGRDLIIPSGQLPVSVYVGPSQVFSHDNTGGSGSLFVHGVEFINSV